MIRRIAPFLRLAGTVIDDAQGRLWHVALLAHAMRTDVRDQVY